MNLGNDELNELCEVAKNAAISSGEYIQSEFESYHQQELKEEGDSIASRIVTSVDLEAQKIILSELNESILKYDLGLLAEEEKDNLSRLVKDKFWSVDPLDGTLPFTEGKTGFAVTISLISKSGDPLIGVVYQPDLDKCYSSVKGKGVFLNDMPFMPGSGDNEDILHVYFDRSMEKESYYETLISELEKWKNNQEINTMEIYFGFGAVCNALSVMNSTQSSYFKFPKKTKGGGCIWDFAATRLFFEELDLEVSNAFGSKLQLNDANTTFMNESGVIYASSKALSQFIAQLMPKIQHLES